ncbi:MAG TPA: hypothetical protein VLI06_14885 [Solimonas sp.]|nr:hypothetical protein [Solimonas sp.]
MSDSNGGLLRGWPLTGCITLALLVMSALLLTQHPGEEGVRLVIRATARTSLLLFVLAFTASALWRLWPGTWTRWQLRNRRYLGVSFAASHAIHLAAIVAFARLDPSEFGSISPVANRIVAGLAYVFIFAMAATSFDRMVAWMGARRWKLLHTAGAHYIWLIFMLSFAKRAIHEPGYLLGVLLLAMALGLRLKARAGGKDRQAVVPG